MTETKKVTYAGIYLALSIILVSIQIPLLPGNGIAIDLALVPIIIGRRHIGNQYALIISSIYPWVTLAGYMGGMLPGVLTLILISYMFIVTDYLFAKIMHNSENLPKKYIFSKMWIWHYFAALTISLILLIFNLFLFWPMYLEGLYDGWLPPNIFDGYFGLIFAITMGTTIIRYCAVYLVISLIYPKIYHYL